MSFLRFIAVGALSSALFAAGKAPVASWNLDEGQGGVTLDSISGSKDKIRHGNWVPGPAGKALLFNGITTSVIRPAERAPQPVNALAVEAWVALQAYPWNWVAVVSREHDRERGFFFGIDAEGHLGFQIALNRRWRVVRSQAVLPLRKWTHIAGSYDASGGLAVYIDGKEAGRVAAKGAITPAADMDLVIGRNQEESVPTGGIRLHSHLPVTFSLEGALQSVRIYDSGLTAEEAGERYAASRPKEAMSMPWRSLPSGPAGPGRFGAYYTKLQFDPGWDGLWRVGPYADVVVRFDESPHKLVFWRGMSYMPAWAAENGIWYNDQSLETWKHGVTGCGEPMSDKRTMTSHVRIIESTDARAVVHWRYALIDVKGVIARVDADSGWGDWVDEYYTIYPDGSGVRKMVLSSSQPLEAHQWQETIIINPPGRSPEENIEENAVTLANLKGEKFTYNWKPAPAAMNQPAGANIQLVNLKARSKPFLVVPPAEQSVHAYLGEFTDKSIFPFWNHWPVSQIPSDGRWAIAPDRTSHSSLTSFSWAPYAVTEESATKIMLTGMTAQPVDELVALAKSWITPPRLTGVQGASSQEYDPTQRAYVLSSGSANVSFQVQAGAESPMVNPAFVLKGWGEARVKLTVDGQAIAPGKAFRTGHVAGLEGTDLIVYLERKASSPVRITLAR